MSYYYDGYYKTYIITYIIYNINTYHIHILVEISQTRNAVLK